MTERARDLIDRDGTRRDFFRVTVGRLAQEVAERTERRVVQERYFRPPGAIDEISFLAACTRCDDCLRVCPANAIVRAPPRAGLAAGTPVIEPEIQPCTVCDEIPCAGVCPTGALVVPERGWADCRIAKLELVPERCVAFRGQECGACARDCPIGDRAITLDAEGRPVLKPEGCVGCGVCVRVCPTYPRSLQLHFVEG